MKIYIYSEAVSPRLTYIAKLLFDDLLGIPSEIISNLESVYEKEFVINYSNQQGVGLQIEPSKLLFEKRILNENPKVGQLEGFPTLFASDKNSFQFDVFSAAFYLVSRYEEYLPHRTDKHNRFDPEQSIAFLNDFLDKPVVNIWAEYLGKRLKEVYPRIEFQSKKFSFINTIDVDYAYAYLEKGIIRTIGALTRDFVTGNFQEFKSRFQTYFGSKEDPFNTFEHILTFHKRLKLNSIFFFHVGDYDENDKSISISSPKMQSLIKGVKDYAEVGLHPSYASSTNHQKLGIELRRLSKVVHQPITKSRNHFIKFKLPQTYRELIELDIKEDYSMGYASKMGFRAGICSPFYFYDLDYDAPTNLKVFPFYLMEATIKYYFEEGPEKAMRYFETYIDLVKKHNGTFVSLWHNDSLSEWGQWEGWSTIYEQMLDYVLKK